jgi:hypothetical protein
MFVVFYQVIGSRCTGSYLVNALTKSDARVVVAKLDPDYTRLRALSVKKAAEEYSMDPEDFLQGVMVPSPNKCVLIESGT